MSEESQYVYCIVESDEARNFGPVGIGGRGDPVTIVSFDGLGAVISPAPLRKYPVTRENTLCHEKVIEGVMSQDYTVLPVRFGTVANSAQEIRDVLRKRSREFKDLLRDMDNRVELGVKAVWLNMEAVFKEVAEENVEIKSLKARAEKGATRGTLIRIGEMVKDALEKKKDKESAHILSPLRRIAADCKVNKCYGDSMFLNSVFLVDRHRERDFDEAIERLRAGYDGRARISYVGPAPPFNFVNIVIHWGN